MGPKITWENIKYGLQNYNENLAYKKLKFNWMEIQVFKLDTAK